MTTGAPDPAGDKAGEEEDHGLRKMLVWVLVVLVLAVAAAALLARLAIRLFDTP